MFTLTVADLRALRACAEGIQAFEQAFPNGIVIPTWAPGCQMIVLGTAGLRPFFGWAVTEGLIPLWSMKGANLSAANLSAANLAGANLSAANLSAANRSPYDVAVTGWAVVDYRFARATTTEVTL